MRVRSLSWFVVALALVALSASPALAGQPVPWQLGFQEAATPVMAFVNDVHNLVLWIITLITLLVLTLLLYASFRFRADRHPTPSRRSHHTLLEVVWTAVPVLILVIIAIPSFRLLYYMDVVPDHELTIKAIGRQWYWTYEYPDHGNFTFDAFMLEDGDRGDDDPRLLATDQRVVVPVDTNVRVLVTASDVLHSWAMPAFGIKMDGIPGRLNETWFRAEREGVFYGQCSELCGVRHGFMPITVEVVSVEAFEAWVAEAQETFPVAGDPGIRVASDLRGADLRGE
jgi:cytochrome c oxidase subunit II